MLYRETLHEIWYSKKKLKKKYLECRILIWLLLFFVNSLILYLHLIPTKNLKDPADTHGLKSNEKNFALEEFFTYTLHPYKVYYIYYIHI